MKRKQQTIEGSFAHSPTKTSTTAVADVAPSPAASSAPAPAPPPKKRQQQLVSRETDEPDKETKKRNIATAPPEELSKMWEFVSNPAHNQTNIEGFASPTCSCLVFHSPFDSEKHISTSRMRKNVTDFAERCHGNQKGYIQIRTAKGEDKGRIMLHHLLLWNHPDEQIRADARKKFCNPGKAEVTHLCHFKACTNPLHVRFEECEINKSRNACKAAVYLGNRLWKTCKHEPPCIETSLNTLHLKEEDAQPVPLQQPTTRK